MKYGDRFRIFQLNDKGMDVVRRAIASTELEFRPSQFRGYGDRRISETAWLDNKELDETLLNIAEHVNQECGWNLKIDGLELVQFGIYPEGGKYDWHVDQHDCIGIDKSGKKVVRKISMSLLLNDTDEYSGGELDLSIYRPDDDPHYETFVLPKGTAVFFQSDEWHRVRPVKSGLRKSLVAWFYGPPYV